MEFLNKVELKGVVGRVSTTKVADKNITNFSLMTEQVNVSEDGLQATEVTWFYCTTFNEIAINKGDHANVLGRLRIRKYTTEGGTERVICEVVAASVTTLERAEEEQK